MRIALLYAPPWKIAPAGQPDYPEHGPPAGYRPGDLDADFHQTPYGLYALGAAALRAGHQVKVLNLSAFDWPRVEEVVEGLDADVYGLSCWTANRRGVALLATALKAHRPASHVVVGGPHATPLATELLDAVPAIDTVCHGESDETFLELCDRLARGASTLGVVGTAWRDAGRAVKGPERAGVRDLDSLAVPHEHYATHILMTSRGCAWACTFCGAETTWGRGFRGHSADYTVRQIELALERLPVRMLQIKDDTFTTNRKRVLELCRKLRQRDLRFLWSCDTRVDVLGDELLREMRLAGCQRLSLGVESGSQRILDAIDKKITPDEILESTALAKKYGIRVRYYMMLGNRGETRESFLETLAFLERARPHEYIFSCLSIYPGTRDFEAARAAGWLDPRVYFEGDFQELKLPFDASAEDTALMNAWFAENAGLRRVHQPSVDECRAVLVLLGEHPPALLDLAVALHDAARDAVGADRDALLAESELLAARCLELGHPCPGLVHDLEACLALLRGDLERMKERLLTAARVDPQHYSLIQNVNRARSWFAARGPERGAPLRLQPSSDFQLLERTAQPALPGPLPGDFREWGAAPTAMPSNPIYLRTPDTEGSRAGLRTSLRTLR